MTRELLAAARDFGSIGLFIFTVFVIAGVA